MKKQLSKTEAAKKIKKFFTNLENKSPRDIKKIKKLAMGYNIPLKEKRKLFCKKCFHLYNSPQIRIKKGYKSVKCQHCGYVARWKLKN